MAVVILRVEICPSPLLKLQNMSIWTCDKKELLGFYTWRDSTFGGTDFCVKNPTPPRGARVTLFGSISNGTVVLSSRSMSIHTGPPPYIQLPVFLTVVGVLRAFCDE